jgi:hypothetical protein
VSASDLEEWFGVRPPKDTPQGGIIGIVEVVDCARSHSSKWSNGVDYAFVLANPRALPFTPWKGIQSLQTPPPALLKQLGL